MRLVGDMQKYTQFQAAESLTAAANNQGGGMAAAGVGMGAGVALGQVMATALSGNTTGNTTVASNADEVTKSLEKIHGLLKAGILTQSEFDAKKTELLKKL